MDETALLEETVGCVIVQAGFKIDSAYLARAKPIDGCPNQGVPGSMSPEIFPDQHVADNPERLISVLLNLGNAEAHDLSRFIKEFPYS